MARMNSSHDAQTPAPPLLTAALPGTGGTFKATPEDFLVEELPAYLPQGEGEHVYVFIEKRDLSTQEAIRALAQHLHLREADVGAAGQKDRQAVTRQWLSLPPGAGPRSGDALDPAALTGVKLELPRGALTILEASRHRNKLRTGHLRGNRFTLTLRGVQGGDALPRARAVLEALRASGVPNRYGDQRFGHDGRNVSDALRMLRGELKIADRFRRRFLVSALQSDLFNRYLDARLRDGLLATVLPGDVLQKRESGGIFTVADEEIAATQARLDIGELAITGPMFGGRMRAPTEGSAAAAREAAALATLAPDEAAQQELFRAMGPLAEGTRRPLLVALGGEDPFVTPHPEDPAALVLRFSLPPGSYATVVLAEVMKT